jgi:hypothetical protein
VLASCCKSSPSSRSVSVVDHHSLRSSLLTDQLGSTDTQLRTSESHVCCGSSEVSSSTVCSRCCLSSSLSKGQQQSSLSWVS